MVVLGSELGRAVRSKFRLEINTDILVYEGFAESLFDIRSSAVLLANGKEQS